MPTSKKTFKRLATRRIVPIAMIVFVAVLILASGAAAIVGGLAWLLYVATAGTAAGTLASRTRLGR